MIDHAANKAYVGVPEKSFSVTSRPGQWLALAPFHGNSARSRLPKDVIASRIADNQDFIVCWD